jgi:Ca-activated chloride channel family protein
MFTTFRNPEFLWLLLLLPAALAFYWRRRVTGAVRFSNVAGLKFIRGAGGGLIGRRALPVLRGVAFALLVVGLARPQQGMEESEITTEGVDIILTVDVSGSMRAEDFTVSGEHRSRIDAVKDVVKEFIQGRESDRIGMVVFATYAYIQCPLTLDYGILLELLDKVQLGMIDANSTAIGSAIAASANRLSKSKAKSKIVILLTDGRNNTGRIDPVTAAKAAAAIGVKIYTIGAGSDKPAPMPMDAMFGARYVAQPVEIDEETLKKIAEITGAKYFRATDTEALRKIYKEIDALEKTEAKVKHYTDYRELFAWFVFPGLGFLLAEIFLANTLLRRIP